MSNNKIIYDVVIIGSGPAGLSAAIYASRANLKTLVVEKGAPGGKMVTTAKIENYPGFTSVGGPELGLKMLDQSKECGVEHKFGDVVEIVSKGDFEKEVHLKRKNEVVYAKTIVIASGMQNKVPRDVKGIEEFNGRGVSYCAICDGPIFGKNPSAIIGGGNSAIEEATYLASIASEVHVFVRDETIIAEKVLVEDAIAKSNIHIHLNSSIKEIKGKDSVESIIADIGGKEQEIKVASIFPYIGFIPNATFASKLGITDKSGFIETNDLMETRVKHIYAIGDIRVKHIRQITTATGDGTIVGKMLANIIK